MEKRSVKEWLHRADMGIFAEETVTQELMERSVATPLAEFLPEKDFAKLRENLSAYNISDRMETYGDLVCLAQRFRYGHAWEEERMFSKVIDAFWAGYSFELKRRYGSGPDREKPGIDFPAFSIPLSELYHAAETRSGNRYSEVIYKNRMLPISECMKQRAAFFSRRTYGGTGSILDPVIMMESIYQKHYLGGMPDDEFDILLYELFAEPYLSLL